MQLSELDFGDVILGVLALLFVGLLVGCGLGVLSATFGDHYNGHYYLQTDSSYDKSGRTYLYYVVEETSRAENHRVLVTEDYDRALALWRELEAKCPAHSSSR